MITRKFRKVYQTEITDSGQSKVYYDAIYDQYIIKHYDKDGKYISEDWTRYGNKRHQVKI